MICYSAGGVVREKGLAAEVLPFGDLPEPGPGAVRVRVHASAVNRATAPPGVHFRVPRDSAISRTSTPDVLKCKLDVRVVRPPGRDHIGQIESGGSIEQSVRSNQGNNTEVGAQVAAWARRPKKL